MSPRRFWLTGASDGIGAALATQLLDQGMQLAINAANPEQHAFWNQRYPNQVLSLSGNLSEREAAQQACAQIAAAWGGIDTVIINAGTCEYVQGQPLDEHVIMQVVQTNQWATAYCAEFSEPLLKTGQHPQLVAIVSPITALPLATSDFTTHYTRLLDMLEKSRESWAQQGIALTVINPGLTDVGNPLEPNGEFPRAWTPQEAALHVLKHLQLRSLHAQLPTLSVDVLWPLPRSA